MIVIPCSNRYELSRDLPDHIRSLFPKCFQHYDRFWPFGDMKTTYVEIPRTDVELKNLVTGKYHNLDTIEYGLSPKVDFDFSNPYIIGCNYFGAYVLCSMFDALKLHAHYDHAIVQVTCDMRWGEIEEAEESISSECILLDNYLIFNNKQDADLFKIQFDFDQFRYVDMKERTYA